MEFSVDERGRYGTKRKKLWQRQTTEVPRKRARMGISYPFECLKRAWARHDEKGARNRGNRIEKGAFGMLVLDFTGCAKPPDGLYWVRA